jgi:GNAT superfamily N-acetyltransferase
MEIELRDCRLPEDVTPLTALLHRAYAEHAARGLRYMATHQGPEITERRIRSGHCFIAENKGVIVGTLTVRKPNPASPVPTYREPATFTFGQFGVEPAARGHGVGRALHDRALRFALENGGAAMALDTAAPADHLIQLYTRWGYRETGRHRWDTTNYESIIMRREIKSPHPAPTVPLRP